jgi:uncharacterized protein
MDAQESLKPRVVFDTSTVVSALLFAHGRLAWLRGHWSSGECVPLVSRATVLELMRVLAYPKFRLKAEERDELLADYLPYCKVIESRRKCPVQCRDPKDQPFLDLALSGRAMLLVSGDHDLLVLAGTVDFTIISPEDYRLDRR